MSNPRTGLELHLRGAVEEACPKLACAAPQSPMRDPASPGGRSDHSDNSSSRRCRPARIERLRSVIVFEEAGLVQPSDERRTVSVGGEKFGEVFDELVRVALA